MCEYKKAFDAVIDPFADGGSTILISTISVVALLREG
jgi:hypothetical protein